MTRYRETYIIDGHEYGIEDNEQPGDHFFPEEYKAGRAMRFRVWRGGCGIGQAKTLVEARALVLKHAAAFVQAALSESATRQQKLLTTWTMLSAKDPLPLFRPVYPRAKAGRRG